VIEIKSRFAFLSAHKRGKKNHYVPEEKTQGKGLPQQRKKRRR